MHMRHESFICAMTHPRVPWLIHVCHDSSTRAYLIHMCNESCHWVMSHVTESWVMSRSHESCHGVMSRSYESCHGVMSHVTELQVMSRSHESCHWITSHVTESWVMSRSHESCHSVMSHVTESCVVWLKAKGIGRRVDDSVTWVTWLTAHINGSWHIWMSHGT